MRVKRHRKKKQEKTRKKGQRSMDTSMNMYPTRGKKQYSEIEYRKHKSLLTGFRNMLASAEGAQEITNKAYNVATELGYMVEFTDNTEKDFWDANGVLEQAQKELLEAIDRIAKAQTPEDRANEKYIMEHKVGAWIQGMMIHTTGIQSVNGIAVAKHQRALALQGMMKHAKECARHKDYKLWIDKCINDMHKTHDDALWLAKHPQKSYKQQVFELYGIIEPDNEDEDEEEDNY